MPIIFKLIVLMLFALIAVPIYIYFLICIIDDILSAYQKLKDKIAEIIYNDEGR